MARTPGSHSKKRPMAEGRARCWRAMRVFGSFSVPQLCMAAETTPSNARFYLRALQSAGFVKKVKEAESGRAGSYDRWALIRNSGPDAPIWRTDQTVFDPNTNLIYQANDHDSVAS